MKRIGILFLVLTLVSCGGGIASFDMEKYDQGDVSFNKPKGWKSQVYTYPDPTIDLIKAGSQVVFYPDSQKMDDILKELALGDVRYQKDLNLGSRSILVFMRGVTNRFFPGATERDGIVFYEGGVSEFKSSTIKSGDVEFEACQALLSQPGVKFDGEALIWVCFGRSQPYQTGPVHQFYAIAVVARHIGQSDRDIFNKVVSSFKF